MKMYIIQFTYVQVSASLIASFFEKKSEHFRTMFPGEPCKSVIHAVNFYLTETKSIFCEFFYSFL